jgi:RND family efflux transporter MFP subunit
MPTSNRPSLDDLRIDPAERSAGRGALFAGILLLLVVAAAAAAWVAQGRWNTPAVRAATVESESPGASGTVLNASGYVTARRRATVSSKVTGKVVEVLVEEGMAVRQGQVLARLDDTSARAMLDLSEAQLTAAERSVAETEVRLREAKVTLGRISGLVREGISNQAELDAAQAAFDSLEARVGLARQQVRVAERQVAVSRTELDNTVIRAPFPGIAISKDAQPGEMVSPISAGGGFTRTGICTIVDMSSLEIEVDVSESYINRVRPGAPVAAVLDAYPEWRIPAHVITTVPAADRQKATVRVRVGFDDLDSRLLPDMGVKVAFLEERDEAAPARARLLVPRSAVLADGPGSIVYVMNGDQVERRAVMAGPAGSDRIEILSGLSPGERIVIEGAERLSDGQRVKLR